MERTLATKLLTIATAIFLVASVCHARIGEDVAQIETRYGKPTKPIAPATVAYQYQQKDRHLCRVC